MTKKADSQRSLTVGYVWTFGATAIPLLSAFLIQLIMARSLGPRSVGLFNITMALATLFLVVGKFGVDGAASRLLSEYEVASPWRISPLVRRSVLLRLLFTVPTGLVATILAPQLTAIYKDPALLILFRMSGLLILAVSLNELSDLMFLGLSRFRFIFSIRILVLVMKVSLVYLAMRVGWGVEGVLAGFIAGTLVPCLIAIALLFRIPGDAVPAGDGEHIWHRLIHLSIPLAVSGASVMIYTIQDKLMLGYFYNATEVGFYSMARSMAEVSLFPTFALTMVLRPGLAGAFARGDREECVLLVNRSIRLSFVYAAAVVVVLACLAEPIVVGLFKPEFEPSATLLLLFLPLIIMRCVSVVVLPGLIAADRAGTYAKLTLAGAIINFVLNAVLIPPLRSGGAIIATLASYIPMEVIGFLALARAIPGYWRRVDTVALFTAVPPAAVIVILFRLFVPRPANLFLAVAEGAFLALIFAATLFPLRVLSWPEVIGAARHIVNSFLTRTRK